MTCGSERLNWDSSSSRSRFDPVGRDGDASIAGRLEDGDSESLVGELWDPRLHPFVDVDRLGRPVRPRCRRTRVCEPWMRPNRKERPPIVVLSHHPAAVAMKPPELAVTGRSLDEVLVTARR